MNQNCVLNILLLFFVFQMNAQIRKVTDAGITNLSKSKMAAGDFNNDGHLDIIISGINTFGTYQCKIYINNSNNTFTDIGANIIALIGGDISLADFDADGYLDIAIIGEDELGKRHSRIYRNNQCNSFTDIAANLRGLCYGSACWADYDNDADLDLLICGQNDSNHRQTLIYKNKGDGTFTETQHGLPNVSRGTATWGDVNKDGLADLAITGMDNSNNYITEIYLNKGDKTFKAYNANLMKLAFTEQQLLDYDNDGDMDFWISGTDKYGINYITLYNNDKGNFVATANTFTPLWKVSASWGDYDADGDVDLIYMGLDDTTPCLFYYRNDITIFTKISLGINGIAEGDLLWMDINNDNKQDLLVSGADNVGHSTTLYNNDLVASNIAPTSPTNLKVIVEKDSVSLSWDAGTDTESGSDGLCYRLCLGTEMGNYNMLSDMLTVSSKNLLPGQTIFKSTSTYIKGLSEGKYYWSVIAIDASGTSSPPAVESSFAICDAVNLGANQEMCTGGELKLSIGTDNDVVDWHSEKEGLLLSGSQALSFKVTQNDKIIAVVAKPYGCSVRDTILLTALPLPKVPLAETAEACYGSTLSFEIGAENEVINWYTQKGDLIYTGNKLELTVQNNETIKCILTDVNNCTDSARVSISSLALPMASLGDDFSICLGDMIHLELLGMQTVDWYSLSGKQLFAGQENISIEITKDTTVIANFINNNNCSNSDTITIAVNSIKGVDAGKDTLICFGTEVQLSALVNGGVAPFEYTWNNSAGETVATVGVISLSPKVNENYTVSVTDNNGCKASDDIMVDINLKPIISAGNNKAVCIGESTVVGGEPSAHNSLFGFSYRWEPQTGLDDPFSENPEVFPTETTFYKMIVSTYNCKADTAEVTVFVNPLPEIVISNDTTIGVGETIEIEAGGGYYYEWSPIEGLSSPYSQSTLVSPIEETTYEVTVEDENGCIGKDAVNIKVLTDLFIPSLFTPNGDGQNDNFKVYGNGIAELQMMIYDRNGSIVFSSNNIRNMQERGWNGKTNGVEQVQGTYIYVISGQYVDGTPIEYNGNRGVVNLMR